MEMETDWSKLPMDLLTSIFAKLAPVEVLMGAGLVCHSWLEAAKLPDLLWRSLDMKHLNSNNNAVLKNKHFLRTMAKIAMDRADGRLETFAADLFVDDELLEYIAERSPSLKSLTLVDCSITNTTLMETVDICPRLELLHVSDQWRPSPWS
ncbi:hypothetical protein BRADI_4g04740v3 [Brachypodium distachyon]|uniref:F-box domain-containing protein n=1 Tax=Brachypodium distachyon TaxID=15368 RepID=A0A0Q3PBB5_BRADI|nr:hypothetical protein BRADI_4g04740v3 [Brachypodium distachyon]